MEMDLSVAVQVAAAIEVKMEFKVEAVFKKAVEVAKESAVEVEIEIEIVFHYSLIISLNRHSSQNQRHSHFKEEKSEISTCKITPKKE